MSRKEVFTTGSGNIFIDLGFSEEEAAELSIKACLFRKLQQALRESELSQAELAKKLGVKQPHVSEILNGKMSGFSTERIAKYLLRLNYDICLDAHPAPGSSGGRVIEIKHARAENVEKRENQIKERR
jgi:predicted XRE-type DNA-binding protein